MNRADGDETVAIPVVDVSRPPPPGSGYRRKRLEFGLLIFVVFISLFSAYIYFTQSKEAADRARDNRALIVRLDTIVAANKAVADCQAAFNRAFVENLRRRTDAAQRGADLTNGLILAIAANPLAKTPSAAEASRAYLTKLFADYTVQSKELKSEDAANPLLPYPDCEHSSAPPGNPQ